MQTTTTTSRSLRGLPLLLGLAALGLAMPAAKVQATMIFTEALMNTSNSATGVEIQNDGTLVRARHFGEATARTVHGVPFQGAAGVGNDSALSGTWGGCWIIDGWVNAGITDPDYLKLTDSLVQALADSTGTKPTLTISGRTPGNIYRLQLFSNSPRGGVAEVEGASYAMQTGDHKFVMLTATWTAADTTLNMRWIVQTNADPVHFSGYALHDITGAGSGTTYAAWAGPSGYHLTGGANDDDDNDGVSNYDEYVFGINPATGTSVNPLTDISELSGLGKFTYTRTANTSPALAYTVWVSTDLADWGVAPVAATQVPRSSLVDGVETVDVTLDAYTPRPAASSSCACKPSEGEEFLNFEF